MGAYSTHLIIDKSQIIKNLKPKNPMWLFRHAESCQVPFSEASGVKPCSFTAYSIICGSLSHMQDPNLDYCRSKFHVL